MKYALENGIVDMPSIKRQIEMKKRQEYLDKHIYSVWCNKQGMWCTYLPKEDARNHRMLYKRKTRDAIDDMIVSYWKSVEQKITIKEVFDEYIAHREEIKRVQPSTILRDKKRFVKYFGEFGQENILTLDKKEVLDFLETSISKYNLTAKEFSTIKGIMKNILKRAKRRELIDWNVNELLDDLDVSDCQFRQVVHDDEKEVFTDDEMRTLIKHIYKNPIPLNLGIALMFVTGIRVGELSALKREDFDGLTFKVKRTETRYQKEEGHYIFEVKDFPKTRAGWRTVIVPKDFEWIIKKLRVANPFGEYLFINKKGERLKGFSFRNQMRKICAKYGIPYKSPHKIRKTYCSILLDNKLDNKLIERQVGHVDISVTEGIYHRDRRALEEKINIFSNIPEFVFKNAINQH